MNKLDKGIGVVLCSCGEKSDRFSVNGYQCVRCFEKFHKDDFSKVSGDKTWPPKKYVVPVKFVPSEIHKDIDKLFIEGLGNFIDDKWEQLKIDYAI